MIDFEKNIQIIEKGGHPVFAVIPHDAWLKIRARLEDDGDVRAYDAARSEEKRHGRRGYPADVARKIASGDNPVAVLRAWRGLSQKRLAEKAGLAVQSVSHIETGVRKGGLAALRKIAAALDVPLDMLAV